MKMWIVLGLILSTNIALAGKLKGKVTKSSDNSMLSMTVSGFDSQSSGNFFALAKKHPQSTVVITGDLNGDGIVESYSIHPRCGAGDCISQEETPTSTTPKRCGSGQCITSLIVSSSVDMEYTSSLFSYIDPVSGQPKVVRHLGRYKTNNQSISGRNISLTISEKTGVSKTRDIEITSKDIRLIIESKDPLDMDNFRKGWDGSIKGNISLPVELSLVSSSGQSISNPLNLLLTPEQGTLEQNGEKASGDQQKLDSILNLIR